MIKPTVKDSIWFLVLVLVVVVHVSNDFGVM